MMIDLILHVDMKSTSYCLSLIIHSFENIQHSLNNIHLLKSSFNTERQWQNVTFKPKGIFSAIVYTTI